MTEQKHKIPYTGIVIMIWLLFSLVNAFWPARAESEREKRSLARFPAVTAARLADGRFEEDFEAYAKDQILFRNALADLHTGLERSMGVREIRGVFITEEGALREALTLSPDLKPLRLPAYKAVSDLFRAGQRPVTLILVPPAAEICWEDLPCVAGGEALAKESRRARESLYSFETGVAGIECGDALRTAFEAGTKVFYDTDHHWTTAGAYAASSVIRQALAGEKVQEKETGWEFLASGTFSGSLSSKCGVFDREDVIEIARPNAELPILVRVSGEDGYRTSLYQRSALASPDPYKVFMGGNYGEVTITTGAGTGRELLVFKDSFFNSFVPFLVDLYDSIHVIDPRYYTGNGAMLLLEHPEAELMVFYGQQTFMTDEALGRLIPEVGL